MLSAKRFTPQAEWPIRNYSFDCYFVWQGFEEVNEWGAGKGLTIKVLRDEEIRAQLEMMEKRGWRDWVRVDMVVEMEVKGEGDVKGDADDKTIIFGGGGDGDGAGARAAETDIKGPDKDAV